MIHYWIPTAAEHRPLPRPIGAAPAPTNPATQVSMNTHADALLQRLLRPHSAADPPTAPEEVFDTTAPPEEEEPDQLDVATSDAFGRLLAALNSPATAGPILDDPLYTVLSRLSHAHPWTTLVLDLKDLMPELDRHYHTHLLVAHLQPIPTPPTLLEIIDQFLYCLALTITHILTPSDSQVDPPDIDSFFFNPNFWHRHLVYGANLASPAFFDASLVDTLAGNQLCQWSTVGATETLLLASHVIIHLPPRVGAYILASHSNLAKLTAEQSGNKNHPRNHYVVRQNVQFRSPQHISRPDLAIQHAREQAAQGRVPAHLIPALASPNTDIINRKITWTLRFPLPAPAVGDPQSHCFADLALHTSGHRSAAALRGALHLANSQSPIEHSSSNSRFIRLPDPTNGTQTVWQNPATPPSADIIRWLRDGAPRVSARLFPKPSTRPDCPEALFQFFSGKLTLSQCAQLIEQHLSDAQDAVNEAKRTFNINKDVGGYRYVRLKYDPSASGAPPSTGNAATTPESLSSGSGVPAQALAIRPRPHQDRSRTPRAPFPTTGPQYDTHFPAFPGPIGAPKGKHKGKDKSKEMSKVPLAPSR